MPPVFFADRLAQLTPTSREAERAVIARALGLDVPAPVRAGADREPLRDSGAQVQRVLCARSVWGMAGYLPPTGAKNYHPLARLYICTFGYSRYFAHAMVC